MIEGPRHRRAGHVDVENVGRGLMLGARRARAPAADRRVDGQHQRGEAGRRDTVDQSFDLGAVRPIVELKPLRRVAPLRGDVLDRHIGVAGHHVRPSRRRRRRARSRTRLRHEIICGVRSAPPGSGVGTALPSSVTRVSMVGDVIEHARPQPQVPPRFDILDRADLVVGAGGTECERGRGHFCRACASKASKSTLSKMRPPAWRP